MAVSWVVVIGHEGKRGRGVQTSFVHVHAFGQRLDDTELSLSDEVFVVRTF